jgi:antirestriction protein ArdC
MNNTIFVDVTNKILEALKKGVVPWKKPWVSLSPRNINGRPYTGINRLLLNLTDYKYPYFLTFKQTSALGGSVKKGEKGNLVVFWKIINGRSKNDGESTVKQIPCLRFYHVFNIDQTSLPISVVKGGDQIRCI